MNKIIQFLLNLFIKREKEHGKGLIASPLDYRDIALSAVKKKFAPLPENYRIPYILRISDQGNKPHCVGYALATLKEEKERRERNFIDFDGDWIYKECKKIDNYDGPGCFDEDTEILTTKGWKNYKTASIKDSYFTLNLNTGNIQIQKPYGFVREKWEGKMYHFYNQRIDILVTPGHKCILKRQNYKYKSNPNQYKRTKVKEYRLVSAKEFPIGGAMPLFTDGFPGAKRKILSDEIVQLIGWIITEGHYDKTGARITIVQNKDGANEIFGLLESENIKYSKYLRKGNKNLCYQVRINAKDSKKIRKIIPDKELHPEFLLKLTRPQLEKLFWTMIRGDGHIDKRWGEIRFNQCPKSHFNTLNSFQVLATLLGYSTFLNKNKVSIIRYNSVRRFKREIIDYNGIVWAPALKNKTVFIRRKGKVLPIGQTYFRAGLKVLQKKGAKPLNGKEKDAEKYRIGGYMRIKDITIENLKQAIYEYGTVLVGFEGSNEGWRTANIRPPKRGERLWGHASAVAVGWEGNTIVVQNSWGKRWGEKGYFYFTKSYLPFCAWCALTDLPNNWKELLGKDKDKPRYFFRNNLWKGLKNDEVRILQNCLKWFSCFDPKIRSTGYYGNITSEAVKCYQRRKGIRPVSGYFGPLTRKEMNKELK